MANDLKSNKLAHVEYQRATNIGGTEGDITERWIIPTFVPESNIKAIDVTGLTEEERVRLQRQLTEYQEYYRTAVQSLFDFPSWLEHTSNESPPILKWRTFKLDNIKKLD